MLEGPEKGIPHYRFNKKILIDKFRKAGFKILDFWIDSEHYYCLLGMRKVKQYSFTKNYLTYSLQ